MKQIGYIYKYNSDEKKGILVFGREKLNFPIKFHYDDCRTNINTGQLVYFELNENKVVNIEHASLANFDRKVLDNVLTQKDRDTIDWYQINTQISYECLDNIVLDSNKNNIFKELPTDSCVECLGEDEDCLEIYDWVDIQFDHQKAKYLKEQLPETIDELYKCFGIYKHNKRRDSVIIDIIDLSLWVDDNVFQDEYFGKDVEQIKYLYDVFVQKKRFDNMGNVIIPPKRDNVISSFSSWKCLLAKLAKSDLKSILQTAPLLQPAFPVKFCEKNIELLSEDYGMPSISLCKKYCFSEINKICTASQYKRWFKNLHQYSHCNANHLKDEGIQMCMMGKKYIKYLEQLLNERYYVSVKKNVVEQFSLLIKQTNDNHSNKIRFTQKRTLTIGTFLDVYNLFPEIFLIFDSCKVLLKTFYDMEPNCQFLLIDSFRSLINNSVIEGAKNEEVTPYILNEQIEVLAEWIDPHTLFNVRNIVNKKFADSDSLEELGYAYKAGFISRVQYYNKFKQLTCNLNTCQLMEMISNNLCDRFPLIIQWYITSKIISMFDFDTVFDLTNMKLINRNINGVCELLKWFQTQVDFRRIDKCILNIVENKILSALNDAERWELFEKGLVSTPGAECVRKKLDKLYKRKNEISELYKKDCFQVIMSTDILSDIDLEIKKIIVNHLNQDYQQALISKCSGFIKLYLWLQNLSEDIEWNLITAYFTQLSEKDQIKLFRYIFFLIAKQKYSLTVDELYDLFVKSTHKACLALCGIMYILKKKLNQPNESISSYELEKIIGLDICDKMQFLYTVKDFFYPCNGYLTLTYLQCETEYQSYNGVLTRDKKGENLYYVISFYDSPVDVFGCEIDWLLDDDYITNAKEVLEHNFVVEVYDYKYYIPVNEEKELRKYVMAYGIDDRCCLLDPEQCMLEKGYYLPEHFYTNYLRCYEKCDNFICRCGNFSDIDSHNGIPYYWCNKRICVRRCHYIMPPSKWENYRFADFLYILLKQNYAKVNLIWELTSEVSHFINEYAHDIERNNIDNNAEERNIISNPLQESEEVGIWTAESTTIKDIVNDDDIEDYYQLNDDPDDLLCEKYRDSDNCYQLVDDSDEPTYEKYGGSYVQDEMGYSDDDIDIIFDGDPTAYWNID